MKRIFHDIYFHNPSKKKNGNWFKVWHAVLSGTFKSMANTIPKLLYVDKKISTGYILIIFKILYRYSSKYHRKLKHYLVLILMMSRKGKLWRPFLLFERNMHSLYSYLYVMLSWFANWTWIWRQRGSLNWIIKN